MAGRPIKDTADWFAHYADASEDERLLKLQSRYGIAGYGVFFKMCELWCNTSGFEINIPDEWWYSVYAKKWDIKESALRDIMKDMIILGLAYDDGKKLYSKRFKKGMEPLFQKRAITRGDHHAIITESEIPITESEIPITESEIPHRREEESREECSKEFNSSTSESGDTPNAQKKAESKELKQTPKEAARDFFLIGERQEQLILQLVSENVPAAVATEEVKKFVAYWTELNSTGKKQRWELQKTFELSKRLTTWFSHVREFAPRARGMSAKDEMIMNIIKSTKI